MIKVNTHMLIVKGGGLTIGESSLHWFAHGLASLKASWCHREWSVLICWFVSWPAPLWRCFHIEHDPSGGCCTWPHTDARTLHNERLCWSRNLVFPLRTLLCFNIFQPNRNCFNFPVPDWGTNETMSALVAYRWAASQALPSIWNASFEWLASICS